MAWDGWRWALLLLVPLGVLALNHVVLPLVARALLRGRLSFSCASLLRGIHELVYTRPGETAPALRVRRISLALHLPRFVGSDGQSRVRLITLCVDGLDVCAPTRTTHAAEHAAAQAAAADKAEAARQYIAHEAHLVRLMRESDEPQSTEQERALTLRRFLECRAKALAHKSKSAAGVLAQHAFALLTAFVALEVRDIEATVPDLDMHLAVDRVTLNGSAHLTYRRRASEVLAGIASLRPDQRVSDGFHDTPSAAAHKRRSLLGRPQGHARVALEVSGVHVSRASHRSTTLAASEGSTTLALHVCLGEAIALASTDVDLALGEATLFVDALQSLLADRPKTPSRKRPTNRGAQVLAAIATLGIRTEAVHARYTLPSTDAYVRASVRDIALKLGTSDASDDVHQAWFGACGVQGHKNHGKHRVPILLEARRVFRAKLDIASIEAHLHGPHRAPLVRVSSIQSWARTSVTPCGMLALRTAAHGAPAFFSNDPNEPAAALYLRIAQVRGAPDLEALHLLGAALPRGAPKKKNSEQRPLTMPRLAVVVHLDSLVYMVHATSASLRPPEKLDEPGTALVLSLPKAYFSMQGSYHERLGAQLKSWCAETAHQRPDTETAPLGVPGMQGSAPYLAPYARASDPHVTPPPPAPCHTTAPEEVPEEVYEPCPLKYQVDCSAGIDVVEVYLSAAHPGTTDLPPRVAHDDILHITTLEALVSTRTPSAVDPVSFTPTLDMARTRSRASLYVHDVEVDLWQAHVLHALSQFGTALGGAPAAPKEDAPDTPLFSRVPRVALMHVGIGSSSFFLGSSDKSFEPDTRRGMGLVLGQSTMDYAHLSKPPYWDARNEASKDARTALRLPNHIGSCARETAHAYGAGAPFSLVQYDAALYPIVDMGAARSKGKPQPASDSTFAKQSGKHRVSIPSEYADEDATSTLAKPPHKHDAEQDLEGTPERTPGAPGTPDAALDTPPRRQPGDPHDKAAPVDQVEPNRPAVSGSPRYVPLEDGEPPELPAHEAPTEPSTTEFMPGAIARASVNMDRIPETINVNIERPQTPPKEKATAIYAPDRWSFDRSFTPLVRTPPYVPRMRQLDATTHIVHIPQLRLDGEFRPPGHGADVAMQVRTHGPVSLRVRLLHTYCILVAVSGILSVLPKRDKAPQAKTQKPKVQIDLQAVLPRLNLTALLPAEREAFAAVNELEVHFRNPRALRVSFALLCGAVPSTQRGLSDKWEEALTVRRLAVSWGEQANALETVFVTGDCLHARIPYAYNTHQLIEGSIVAFKASKQLFFQLVKGYEGSAIYPHAEAPKRLPPISIRMRMACFEAADNAFDSRLALILRAGADEQLMRMERGRLFDMRAQTEHAVPTDEAHERLLALDSSLWVRRFHNALHERQRRERELLAYIHKRVSDPAAASHDALPIPLVPTPADPPLARMLMTQLCVDVSRPASYPLDKTHEFLHEQAGNPVELEYTTLIPLYLRWRMTEAVVRLRDYPVPLLHIPPCVGGKDGEGAAAPCFDAEGDLCIAEQLGTDYSVRHVPVTILPAIEGQQSVEHGLLVPKSVMSPKLYGTLTVHVATTAPTHFAWGQSMQPAIQDLIRVVDCITSPPHDPSPKPGPWDKLPFQLQGRLHLSFAGDVRLHLKGSRDPYQVSGSGAGFVLGWGKHVEVRLGFPNPDQEFLQVISGEHLLAIPDLAHVVDPYGTGLRESAPSDRQRMTTVLARAPVWPMPPLAKVVWRLSNGVRWGMGLVPERTCTDKTCERDPKCEGTPFYRKCRFFGRIPHWKVITRSREGFDRLPKEEQTDSFAGWRSDFVHLSLSLQAIGDGAGVPLDEDEMPDLAAGINALNNLYITPLAWDHFWEWKNLFNSALSLPIRQGPVFPKPPGQKSPKFGLHLATIKYRFNLSPLCITHVYRQRMRYDLAHGLRTFVGVKAKLGTFYLDMHQRLQETVHERPGTDKPPIRAFHKPFYEAESDLSDLELFCLGARFKEQFGYTPGIDDDHDQRFDLFGEFFTDSTESSTEDPLYDPDDYVELDNVPLEDVPPRLRIHQALSLARFNFHRRVESRHDYMQRPNAPQESYQRTTSKFGHENTHTCLIGSSRKVMDEHLAVAYRRVRHIEGDIESGKAMQVASAGSAPKTRERYAARIERLESVLGRLRDHCKLIEEHRQNKDSLDDVPQAEIDTLHHAMATGEGAPNFASDTVNAEMRKEWESFNNQLLVYSPVGILSNQTRDLLMRYYTSSKLHRRFSQHLSVSEQREIHELLEKKIKTEDEEAVHDEENQDPVSLLGDLVQDTVRLAEQHTGLPHTFLGDFGAESSKEHHPADAISEDYILRKKTICLCVQPQLVLRSKASRKATLIFHANQLRVRNYAVSDENYMDDSKNRNVLHRNFISMQSLQCFHTLRDLDSDADRNLRRLALPASLLTQHNTEQAEFQRIMRETHAFVLYDKHNQGRLNDPTRPVLIKDRRDDLSVGYLEHHMDLVRVLCPRFTLTATNEQYSAIYTVVTDLILQTDPMYKEHAQKRDSIVYAYNFDDPDLVTALISTLQLRIHDLLNLRRVYEAHYGQLNGSGRTEYVRISAELLDQYLELTLIEEAVRMSHASVRDKEKQFAMLLQCFAESVEWNMIGDVDVPNADPLLARLVLSRASFARLSLANGTSTNSLTLGDVNARNAHPTAFFEEIIARYVPKTHEHDMVKRDLFLSTAWLLLPPAGGVAIVDRFEFHLHPIRVQLELKVGKQLMDYLFGTHRAKQEEEHEAVEDTPKTKRWLRRLLHRRSKGELHEEFSSEDEDEDTEMDTALEGLGITGAPTSDSSSQHTNEPHRAFALANIARMSRWDDDDQDSVANNEAVRAEMARRASEYLSFIQVIFNKLTVCLSYKGDAEHSLTNLYDLEFQTPRLEYTNLLGSYGDLADALKKDMIRIAWQNRNTLLKGVIATNNKKRTALKRLRANRLLKYGDSASDVKRQLQLIGEEGVHELEQIVDDRLGESQGGITHEVQDAVHTIEAMHKNDDDDQTPTQEALPPPPKHTSTMPPPSGHSGTMPPPSGYPGAAPPLVPSMYGAPSYLGQDVRDATPTPPAPSSAPSSAPTPTVRSSAATPQSRPGTPQSAAPRLDAREAPPSQTGSPSRSESGKRGRLRRFLHLPPKHS